MKSRCKDGTRHTMTFVASPRIRSRSGAYTRIGAFTHPTPRLRICACTRWCVRLRERWVRIRTLHICYMYMAVVHPGVYTRGSVAVYASGGCVYTGGVYTHPTRIHRFLRICTPVPRPRICRFVDSCVGGANTQESTETYDEPPHIRSHSVSQCCVNEHDTVLLCTPVRYPWCFSPSIDQ